MSDAALVKEELERVIGLYAAQLRHFRRTLWIVMVSALALFALIVLPFLTYRAEVAAERAQETRLADLIAETEARIATLQDEAAELQSVWNQVNDFAASYSNPGGYDDLLKLARLRDDHLKDVKDMHSAYDAPGMADWIAGRTDRPSKDAILGSRMLRSVDGQECAWKTEVPFIACQLCGRFSELAGDIERQVKRLSIGEDEAIGPRVARLHEIAARACTWLRDGENHWRYNRPILTERFEMFPRFLRVEFHDFRAPVSSLSQLYRDHIKEAELTLAKARRDQAVNAEKLLLLESHLARISDFNRIGTPVGDLPISLGQLVLLFPVVLALSYLVVANALAHAAQLRRRLAQLAAMRDEGGGVLDRAHLSVIAPLWLGLQEDIATRAAHWAVLLLPFGLICLNLYMIQDTEALTANFADDAVIGPRIYLGLYAVSLLLALFSLWHMHRVTRRISAEPA